MTHVAPLLRLVLFSVLLWTAAGSSVLCSWTQVLPDGDVQQVFLRAAPPRLHRGAWSAQRGCVWSDDAALIHQHLSACREREFSDHPDGTVDVESTLAAELCVSVGSPARPPRSVEDHGGRAERSEVGTHRRVRRGFIVPGTLWCGSGNKALSYEDLGVFSDTDSCCREHDRCNHSIPSFHSQFGVFNSNIFTMSHCDCDHKFHSCLMAAQDRISAVVGFTFFNLLEMHCFDFSQRLQCTQRNWFGMCKETEMSLYAVVHPPKLYDSPNATEVSVNATEVSVNATEVSVNATAPTEMLTSTEMMWSTSSAAASTPPPEGLAGPPPEGLAGPPPEGVGDVGNTLEPTRPGLNISEKQRSGCSVYKDLDRCRNRIRPQQQKYGLLNPETRTLYHCNCTSRLFQTLSRQNQLTSGQEVLLDRVARACFLSPDCTAGTTCAAVLVRAELPPEGRSSRAHKEEQRHLLAGQLKAGRPKRRDGAVRLHQLCLGAVRNRTRTRGPAAGEENHRGSK